MNEYYTKNKVIIFLLILMGLTMVIFNILDFEASYFYKFIIYVHVVLGGIAFFIGGFALFSKKGANLHKKSGKIFYYSLGSSLVLSLFISLVPGHQSPTLFSIGILSIYLLIGGYRSIKFKNKAHDITVDKYLAYMIIISSVLINIYSLATDGAIYPLRAVFGLIGFIFGIMDLVLFRQLEKIRRRWLVFHLSKMIGAYTASVTAFFVSQRFLSGYYDWFVPTFVGISIVGYWLFKLNRKSLIS